MSTKKRWNSVYKDENPFGLPQKIKKELRRKSSQVNGANESIRYLWIVISKDGARVGAAEDAKPSLDKDGWLNLIDETAALGVRSVVVSIGSELANFSEIWEICHWAQNIHGLLVGLHFTSPHVVDEAVPHIRELDQKLTYVFLNSHYTEATRAMKQHGFHVLPADGHQEGEVRHQHCSLPGEMACVCSNGSLWTCGLVVEDQNFYLGDSKLDRMDAIMHDETLPHEVPECNTRITEHNRCDGCPPLIAKRMNQEAEGSSSKE